MTLTRDLSTLLGDQQFADVRFLVEVHINNKTFFNTSQLIIKLLVSIPFIFIIN